MSVWVALFFRRFYLRNSYCETEPSLVAASCVYVAAKAEETPVHVKSAVSEAKAVFNGECAFKLSVRLSSTYSQER